MRAQTTWLRPALAAAALALAATARAAVPAAPVYDLDSLVYQASEIVEVEVVRAYRLNQRDLLDVKITAAHSGALKPGETVTIAGAQNYLKPSSISPAGEPLAAGDRLLLFLQPSVVLLGAAAPPNTESFAPVPSGIKILRDANLHDFISNYDGRFYVADMPAPPPPPGVPLPPDAPAMQPAGEGRDTAEVRASIAPSLALAADWRHLLESPPSGADIPKLTQLLQQRGAVTQPGARTRDAIGEAAAVRLANFHDPDALAAAMLANPAQAELLAPGFGTPAGREFLLRRLADPSAPRAQRIAFAGALRGAGVIYRSTLDYNGDREVFASGEADVKNSSYLTRIAIIADGQSADEELTVALLRGLQWQAALAKARNDGAVLADLADAANYLRLLYAKPVSGRVKFEVECLAWQIGPKSFEPLKARGGPVLSSLRLASQEAEPPPGAGKALEVQLNYQLLPGAERITKGVIIVKPFATGQAVVLERRSLPWAASGGRGGGSVRELVALPPGIAPGRYLIYYIFLAGEMVVSEGHGFETEL